MALQENLDPPQQKKTLKKISTLWNEVLFDFRLLKTLLKESKVLTLLIEVNLKY